MTAEPRKAKAPPREGKKGLFEVRSLVGYYCRARRVKVHWGLEGQFGNWARLMAKV